MTYSLHCMYSLAEQAAWSWMHITWGHLGCRRPERLQPVTSSFIIIPHCHDHRHHHRHHHHHHRHHGCHPIVGGQWIWATGRCLANGGECKIGEAIYKQCSNATSKGEPRTHFVKWEEFPKRVETRFREAPPFISTALFFSWGQHHHLDQKYLHSPTQVPRLTLGLDWGTLLTVLNILLSKGRLNRPYSLNFQIRSTPQIGLRKFSSLKFVKNLQHNMLDWTHPEY